ncbi:heme-binding protein [Aneurinibacillus thermoaerophilus]|nr:heme-binding protein [Aneurinibacillus thermoaerophilus]MED0764171.1 heme-binding protein [Aneurinibacillus thermoaerophilus]
MGTLTLEMAKEMIEHAEHEARKIGVPMVVSVVDEGGNFIACHRMDDALLVSVDIAQNKAWTSVALKMPTEKLAEAGAPGAELYGINTTNSGRVVLFGGGIPLFSDNKVVGAVGVSGGSVKEDIQVAQAAVKAFEKMATQVKA